MAKNEQAVKLFESLLNIVIKVKKAFESLDNPFERTTELAQSFPNRKYRNIECFDVYNLKNFYAVLDNEDGDEIRISVNIMDDNKVYTVLSGNRGRDGYHPFEDGFVKKTDLEYKMHSLPDYSYIDYTTEYRRENASIAVDPAKFKAIINDFKSLLNDIKSI